MRLGRLRPELGGAVVSLYMASAPPPSPGVPSTPRGWKLKAAVTVTVPLSVPRFGAPYWHWQQALKLAA